MSDKINASGVKPDILEIVYEAFTGSDAGISTKLSLEHISNLPSPVIGVISSLYPLFLRYKLFYT